MKSSPGATISACALNTILILVGKLKFSTNQIKELFSFLACPNNLTIVLCILVCFASLPRVLQRSNIETYKRIPLR